MRKLAEAMRLFHSSHLRLQRLSSSYHYLPSDHARCHSTSLKSDAAEDITEDDMNRFYILGLGNKGIFQAAGLRLKPNPPPVTLLTTNRERAEEFINRGKKISLLMDGQTQEVGGFDIEVIPKLSPTAPRGNEIPREFDDNKNDKLPITTASARPIFNLICAVRGQWTAQAIFEVRERLRPDSAVLSLADGLGVLEEVFAMNFPDHRTRPSFRLGWTSHRLYELAPGTDGTKMKDNWQSSMAGQVNHYAGFSLMYMGKGHLLIAPPATNSLSKDKIQSKIEEKLRTQDTEYLVNHLLDSPILSASTVSHKVHLFLRYKKLIRDAIIGPTITHFECDGALLAQHPEAQILMGRLSEEAWEVLRRDIPDTPVSIDEIKSWVQHELYLDRIHSMAFHAMQGMDTGIEKINGWLIGRALQHGLILKEHQRMMDLVIKKTLENSIKLRRHPPGNNFSDTQEHSPAAKNYGNAEARSSIEKPDRVELIREQKLKKQREIFGNQPMPTTYTKPQIAPMGNQRILREKKS